MGIRRPTPKPSSDGQPAEPVAITLPSAKDPIGPPTPPEQDPRHDTQPAPSS